MMNNANLVLKELVQIAPKFLLAQAVKANRTGIFTCLHVKIVYVDVASSGYGGPKCGTTYETVYRNQHFNLSRKFTFLIEMLT